MPMDASKYPKSAHYEDKRSEYMPPPDDAGLIDEFTFDPAVMNKMSRSELKRCVVATLTAFWQADAAYQELKSKLL